MHHFNRKSSIPGACICCVVVGETFERIVSLTVSDSFESDLRYFWNVFGLKQYNIFNFRPYLPAESKDFKFKIGNLKFKI